MNEKYKPRDPPAKSVIEELNKKFMIDKLEYIRDTISQNARLLHIIADYPRVSPQIRKKLFNTICEQLNLLDKVRLDLQEKNDE